MKIVINRCYGGFSLSLQAILELIKMGSPTIKRNLLSKYYGSWEKAEIKPEFDSDKKVPFTDGFLTTKFAGRTLYDTRHAYYIENDDAVSFRTHPDVIRVVEMLGKEAGGDCAELGIIEIPDDVVVEIDEYDGIESVHEIHRSWP